MAVAKDSGQVQMPSFELRPLEQTRLNLMNATTVTPSPPGITLAVKSAAEEEHYSELSKHM